MKKDLNKCDLVLRDNTGAIVITVWEENIDKVNVDNSYCFHLVTLNSFHRMFCDKSNVSGSLKNMTWKYTVTQSAKKATGMLKLEKLEKSKRKFRSGTSETIK